VVLSVRKRMPFVLAYPRCPASACMTQLAMRLASGVPATQLGAAVSEPPSDASTRSGFFSRLSRWFRK
jgi:hypothetical protein